MAEPRTIRFLFDYISSNAYLAWVRLPEIAAKHRAVVEPVPVLFAGFLEAHGQLGPAEVRPKAYWMFRNNLRKAALLGVPLEPPRFHPFSPLLPLRVSSLPLPGDRRRALIDALFQAVWVRGLHASDPAVVAALADEVGLPGAALVAQAQEPEAKARLRRQTDDAIAAGAFGVPTMLVGDELFWGYDDLPMLELHLAGADPLDPGEAVKWTGQVRPSAMRRRFRADEGGARAAAVATDAPAAVTPARDAAPEDARPPVWVGHVALPTPDIPATRELMLKLGLRDVGQGDGVAVLELRGGTHLVLLRAAEPASGPAYFDLMVDDLAATHARLEGLGLAPSAIAKGDIHDSFTLSSPSGHVLTFQSSHVSGKPV